MELILDQRLHREQHIAVRVIKQIERGEHEQRGAGMELLLGHRSNEYSMAEKSGPACMITIDIINGSRYASLVIKTFQQGNGGNLEKRQDSGCTASKRDETEASHDRGRRDAGRFKGASRKPAGETARRSSRSVQHTNQRSVQDLLRLARTRRLRCGNHRLPLRPIGMSIIRKGTPNWRVHPGGILREEFLKPMGISP